MNFLNNVQVKGRIIGQEIAVKIAEINENTTVLIPAECMDAELYLEGYDAYFSNQVDISREKMNHPDFSAGYWDAADIDLENNVERIAVQQEQTPSGLDKADNDRFDLNDFFASWE